MSRSFASVNDLEEKVQTLEVLADGVYALTAEGDPNIGAIEGDDFLVCFESLATPVATRRWLDQLREHTDKPVRYVVLSHYHAVRVLGASAFGDVEIIAHENTRKLIEERGEADWHSEFGRFPRLAQNSESIPGLTYPSLTFGDRMTIDLGPERGDLVLEHVGRGHTSGDIVAWLPQQKILFAGDLVEGRAALYTGDAHHREWASDTLDRVQGYRAEQLVGGRGEVLKGHVAVEEAIGQSRLFLETMIREVSAVRDRGGDVAEAYWAAQNTMQSRWGELPIFEHCMPFNVARLWDELSGVDDPIIWTAERDREVWAELTA